MLNLSWLLENKMLQWFIKFGKHRDGKWSQSVRPEYITMKGREIKMKKDKNKIVKMATLFSAVTVSGGSIAGCGTPVKGDIYEYKYNNRDQQYVLASQRGGTSL